MKTWEKVAFGCLGCGAITVVGIALTCGLLFNQADKLRKQASVSRGVSPSSNFVPTNTPKTLWEYETEVDKMGRGDIHYARLTSTNTLEFGFPYRGPQHATLTLRKKAGRTDAILEIERGQFMAGVDGTSVDVSFDGQKPTRFHANGPTDHSSTVLFLDNANGFITKLKAAKKVNVQTTVYQEGSPVMTFECDNLVWQN